MSYDISHIILTDIEIDNVDIASIDTKIHWPIPISILRFYTMIVDTQCMSCFYTKNMLIASLWPILHVRGGGGG